MENKSQNNKILRYGAARQEKTTKQWKRTFWKCSQKDPLPLFPKAFFALLCPSSLGWGTSSAQRQNGPSGYLMSIIAFYIRRWWAPNPGPRTHTAGLVRRSSQGFPVRGGKHPERAWTLPRAGTEAASDQGQKFPVKLKNPGRTGSLRGNNATEVRSGWWLPRAPTEMIFWEMSTTSVNKTLQNTLTQAVGIAGHLEVWEIFFTFVQC